MSSRHRVRTALAAAAGAALALAAGAATAAWQARSERAPPPARPAPAVAAAGCDPSVTDNAWLDPQPLPPDPRPAPLACRPGGGRGPAGLALAELRTPSGLTLRVGRGGQVWSIALPGGRELIAPPPADAPHVDWVLQTVATDVDRRQASARAVAQRAGDGPAARAGAGWHYHQAGPYLRGALAGHAPVYSPLLFHRFDAAAGRIETLNLAAQAHPVPEKAQAFLVYMRLQHLGEDVFELTQAWIDDGEKGGGTLNHFNLPWLALDGDAVPRVRWAAAGGGWSEAGERTWAEAGDSSAEDVGAVAAYAGTGEGAQGMALVLPADGGTRLRAGRRGGPASGARAQHLYIVSGVRRATLDPGEVLVSRVYLVFGTRAAIERKAAALQARAGVRELRPAPSTDPRDVVALCGEARLRPCAAGHAPRLTLLADLCGGCAPVFELADGRGRTTLSTDPYLGAPAGRELAEPASRSIRLVGWLPPRGARLPAGYAAAEPTGVRLSPGEAVRFTALRAAARR